MKQSKTLRRWELALLLGVACAALLGVWLDGAQAALSDQVIRLHVLANSDSEADQALKLRVRDRVLERATELLEQSADRQEAEALLRGNLLELENLAAEEIAAAGYDYPVTAELTDTTFPTREYDGFTLPAGEYLALRIVIGEGAGQNWWCVVFPPLCQGTSVEAQPALAALGEEEAALLTGESEGYVLKFKAMELWEGFRRWAEGA